MTPKGSGAQVESLGRVMAGDEEFVREAVREALEDVLEAEMEEALGAAKGERTSERQGYRSGYYKRGLITRIGKIELRVPQLRGRIALVGVEPLRDGDEPNSAGLQLLNAVEAIDQRAAEAVELPDQHAVEQPAAGVGHELVQARPAGLLAADDVVVRLNQFPAHARGVVGEFGQLQVGVLVGGGDADVDGRLHAAPPVERDFTTLKLGQRGGSPGARLSSGELAATATDESKTTWDRFGTFSPQFRSLAVAQRRI